MSIQFVAFIQLIPRQVQVAIFGICLGFSPMVISWCFKRLKKGTEKRRSASPPLYLAGINDNDALSTVLSRNWKNLGIFDSVTTFSKWTRHDPDLKVYNRMIKTCNDPCVSFPVDIHLIELLRRNSGLAQRWNGKLGDLAVQGFHAMLIFVFQDVEDPLTSTEALVDLQDDNSACAQVNLTHLTSLIESTILLNDEFSKANQLLITAIHRRIEKIKRAKGNVELYGFEYDQLESALSIVIALEENLDNWRGELRLYLFNVKFTKVCSVVL
ncbi:hypothetical protein PSTT_10107 [Puccinia striiformis]|uniref:Uncharacterized protein n=1 Tax=Puccinia striiformis TaxID=27350 RepID=A0A2S4V5S4_9BASI|nr:hypothetical protein PSTT_10107 [Puccinia striiformis]